VRFLGVGLTVVNGFVSAIVNYKIWGSAAEL